MKIHKSMTNMEIVDLLRSVSAAYQISEGNKARFKIIAYGRAADAVEHLSSEAKDLWDEGKLESVSGIGPSIASHLDEIFRTGKSKHFKKVMDGIPPATFEIIKISGIGPKTAQKLTKEFKISDDKPLGDLRKLAESGKIAELEGFGRDSAEAIVVSIDDSENREIRLLLPYAEQIGKEIVDWMSKSKSVKKIEVLGSLRRRASTIGDVDFAVASDKPHEAIVHFCNYPKKVRVLEKGDRTASLILPGNKKVDMMVESLDAYGALLQHFTGSKHHNIALRKIALKKGYSLSDYGVKSISDKSGKVKKFATEEELYKFFGMSYIPPELREDKGEIELAQMGKIPNLVETKDIKSDLQIHSDFDIETSHDLGSSSMTEIAKKADEVGYEYIALTEHNPSHSKHSKKQIVELLRKKKDATNKLNNKLEKYKNLKKVFNSLEIDILPKGNLPVPEEALELLDFALVSIHSSFRLSKSEMTKRVLAGLDNPGVKIFAHPTGRKLNEREGIELDWEKVFEFCKDRNIWIEINAAPSRLDLPDVLVKDAIAHGILLTLGTDAHSTDQLENMVYGVSVARRGWAEKEHIVNTRDLLQFQKLLD
ncbi:helix-hairpin-helix domain-containing protein [Patescibacteria group bacterium]